MKKKKKTSTLPQILILSGLLILIAVVLVIKASDQPASGATAQNSQLPEEQLEAALRSNQPVLAFFHSNNCRSCIEMMETVESVYPEYQAEIVLVDIDVYDPQNQGLLRAAGIRAIPTLVFFDRQGQGQSVIGAMQPDALRQTLESLRSN